MNKKEKIEVYNKANGVLESELRKLLFPFSNEYQYKVLRMVETLRANDKVLEKLKK